MGNHLKLQSSWKGLCKVITRINDVVCQIQRHPRATMMAVHLDRLTSYLGLLGTTSFEGRAVHEFFQKE
jgi:hypothetical protein